MTTDDVEHALPPEARPRWVATRKRFRAELLRSLAEHGTAEAAFAAFTARDLGLPDTERIHSLTDELVDAMLHRANVRKATERVDEHLAMHAPHVRLGVASDDPQWLSFYHPQAELMLGGDIMRPMSYSRRDDLECALAALPQDWRYSEVERRLLRMYLEERLEAFENDTEPLDVVERRAFGYRG